jgi:hypothetical protein
MRPAARLSPLSEIGGATTRVHRLEDCRVSCLSVNDSTTKKDFGQLVFEQRRNARRTLRSYVEECRVRWPALSEEERELCREAMRNLVERADLLVP